MLVLAIAVDVNDLLVGSGQSRLVLGSFLRPCCAGRGRALGDSREPASSGLLGFSSFPLFVCVTVYCQAKGAAFSSRVLRWERCWHFLALCRERRSLGWKGPQEGTTWFQPLPWARPLLWPGLGTPSSSPCPHIWCQSLTGLSGLGEVVPFRVKFPVPFVFLIQFYKLPVLRRL